jgi:hypothetical protein
MRLPDDYDNTHPYRLIFGFHWNGGNSKEVDTGGTNGYQMAHFGLQKLSNNGAIFVAPDGIGGGWANSGGRDLQFVDDMVALIKENYCVDERGLFANGFSYGGGMSYALACARADVFRGVAIYDGAVLSGCDGGYDPIAYWQMAGLTDGVCTLDMAKPMRDRFVQNNGCTPQDPPQPPPPPPYLSPGGHVCTDYAGCSGEHPLRWCVHQSGHGNAIVDGTADLYNSCATPPNSCSDACPCTWVPADVWSFFSSLCQEDRTPMMEPTTPASRVAPARSCGALVAVLALLGGACSSSDSERSAAGGNSGFSASGGVAGTDGASGGLPGAGGGTTSGGGPRAGGPPAASGAPAVCRSREDRLPTVAPREAAASGGGRPLAPPNRAGERRVSGASPGAGELPKAGARPVPAVWSRAPRRSRGVRRRPAGNRAWGVCPDPAGRMRAEIPLRAARWSWWTRPTCGCCREARSTTDRSCTGRACWRRWTPTGCFYEYRRLANLPSRAA